MINFIKRWPWSVILIIAGLLLLDLSVHPLTIGPDRLIHDPAVYRIRDHSYMPGDWYTDMAVKSNVYTFYARVVNAYNTFHIHEELWRTLLYLASLILLYYAIIRIAQIFSKNILVIPILAIIHMLLTTGDNQPIWLYGPFIQIDGGLAPRSIGIALSFLALYFLTRGGITIASLLLGLSTLVHVSNSLIVFTLFFLVWVLYSLSTSRPLNRSRLLELCRKAIVALVIYLLAGGWFALYIGLQGSMKEIDFPTQKFIWSWIYFRAPYMALPLLSTYWWIRLVAPVAAVIIGWLLLRRHLDDKGKKASIILLLVALCSVGYFFLFYLFAFVWPWLPGFQFYSIRVIYLTYFVAYLFISLCLLIIGKDILTKIGRRVNLTSPMIISGLTTLLIIIFFVVIGWRLGGSYNLAQTKNLQISAYRLLDNSVIGRNKVPENLRVTPPPTATFQYLYNYPEPFLAPINLRTMHYYLPSIVSFKSFGFTAEGLPEWFSRVNDVSRGELQRIYELQLNTGKFESANLDANRFYNQLTQEEVIKLSQKYHFTLFLVSVDTSYSFPVVAQDNDYRLYRVSSSAKSGNNSH